MWITFYKNSVSLNLYSRLNFSLGASTYSNLSKFAPSRFFGQRGWGQSGWSILFIRYMITIKILRIRNRRPFECTCLFTSHFCLFFCHNAIWWFVYDWSSTVISSNGPMKTVLHIKELVAILWWLPRLILIF